jgi:hypothetical protein
MRIYFLLALTVGLGLTLLRADSSDDKISMLAAGCVSSFPSFTWERACGGHFMADPAPFSPRSQREMKFREGRKYSELKLGSGIFYILPPYNLKANFL